jgi:hypothetical protein
VGKSNVGEQVIKRICDIILCLILAPMVIIWYGIESIINQRMMWRLGGNIAEGKVAVFFGYIFLVIGLIFFIVALIVYIANYPKFLLLRNQE